jgi:DNA (cytosine-5)-methyltransferase 1
MTHGSLFSGIGGFDLAAEWAGFTNLFNCEWEEFPRKVLKHHFPNAEQYGDIKEFDATTFSGRIDILSGGFPCQPFSVAGQRKGTEDERHLWPEMLRVIGECQPRWVVGENVRGLVNWSDGLVLEACYSDLENLGYSVQSFIIPACATGAPHRRDRVWIVAHSDNFGTRSRLREVQSKDGEIPERNNNAKLSDTDSRNAPDTDLQECNRRGKNNKRERGESIEGRHDKKGIRSRIARPCKVTDAPDTDNERLQRSKKRRGFESCWKKRDEQPSRRIRTEWENFPTVPPVCGGDDGLPKELDGITFSKWRRESIKAYGNAIVPQVALRIFEAIQEYEKRT